MLDGPSIARNAQTQTTRRVFVDGGKAISFAAAAMPETKELAKAEACFWWVGWWLCGTKRSFAAPPPMPAFVAAIRKCQAHLMASSGIWSPIGSCHCAFHHFFLVRISRCNLVCVGTQHRKPHDKPTAIQDHVPNELPPDALRDGSYD